MALLMNERQRKWLHEVAGLRIDALEAALESFKPRHIESIIALRRQIVCVLREARELELGSLAAVAERAEKAGALDLRGAADMLLSLLRGTAGSTRAPERPAAGELDTQTGLLNAAAFMRRLDHLEHDEGAQVAMATIHVSGYDAVCARHGEKTGHLMLRHVAGVIARQLREDDSVAHMRGPEFAVLLPEEDIDGLQIALKRLEAAVGNHPFRLLDGQTEPVHITTSGACLHGEPGKSPDGGSAGRAAGADIAPPVAGVVVNSAATRMAIANVLRRAGYGVVQPLESGRDRLAPVAHHKLHALFVEDAVEHLPATLVSVREALGRRRTPVIVIVPDALTGLRAMEQGATEFLLKPVSTDDMTRMLASLTHRAHHAAKARPGKATGGGLLVASDSIGQLIAIGTSLQRQAGYPVRLGRGAKDATEQARRHAPAAAVIDTPLVDDGVHELCEALAGQDPAPSVVLLGGASDPERAAAVKRPRVAGVIAKPVPLKSLHLDVLKATGVVPSVSSDESARILRDEILRLLRDGAAV